MPTCYGIVEVYRNLHSGTWSVRQAGLVVAHLRSVVLVDAVCVVQPAGRERVRREHRKNVHAYIRGTFAGPEAAVGADLAPLSYNPYLYDSFVDAVGSPVHAATVVVFHPDMTVTAAPTDS